MHSKQVNITHEYAHLFWRGMRMKEDDSDTHWSIVLDIHTERTPSGFTCSLVYCPEKYVEMAQDYPVGIEPDWVPYQENAFGYVWFRERLGKPACKHTKVNDIGFAAYCVGCDAKMTRVNFEWKVVG